MQNVRFLANFITEAGILVNRSKVSSNPLQCSRLGKNDDLLRRKNKEWMKWASDDEGSSTEAHGRAIIEVLGREKRNEVLAALYMVRADVSLSVRQVMIYLLITFFLTRFIIIWKYKSQQSKLNASFLRLHYTCGKLLWQILQRLLGRLCQF
jgi:hypothetical protein